MTAANPSATGPDVTEIWIQTGLPSVDIVMTNLTSTTVKQSHSPLRRFPRRRAGLAAGIFALALLGAACGSSAKPNVSTGGNSPSSSDTTATTTTQQSAGGSGGVGF